MFLSTFELLLNVTQLPRQVGGMQLPALEELRPISREVLQGYFLTISNLEDRSVELRITFVVVTDPKEDQFKEKIVASFFDVNGINEGLPISTLTPQRKSISLTIPAKDTGLLLVQPNPFLLLKPLKESEIEIRGHVEIEHMIPSGSKTSQKVKVLLTPEQRGTFYKLIVPKLDDGSFDFNANLELDDDDQQLDQIAYSIPTTTGGSLFEL